MGLSKEGLRREQARKYIVYHISPIIFTGGVVISVLGVATNNRIDEIRQSEAAQAAQARQELLTICEKSASLGILDKVKDCKISIEVGYRERIEEIDGSIKPYRDFSKGTQEQGAAMVTIGVGVKLLDGFKNRRKSKKKS